MKRMGERGENKWERISWDEAIETITSKWKGYMAEFGDQSVSLVGASAAQGYINGGGGVSLSARLQNILGWSAISGCADYALPKGINKVFGPASNVYGWPAFEPRNVVQSKTYIAWSANKTVASLQDWWAIMIARENGTKLVVVDPIFTTIASKADLWVRPRPGSDTALVLSMMQVIVSEGWQDEDFIVKHTVAPLLVREDTKQFLKMSDVGIEPIEGPVNPLTGQPTVIDPFATWDASIQAVTPIDEAATPNIKGSHTINGIKVRTAWDLLVDEINQYPPEKATEICDVNPETIRELARISALEGPVDHAVTYGSQAYDNGVALGHAMATLVAITGNMGKPGAGFGSNAYSFPFNYTFLFPSGRMGISVPQLALPDVLATGTYNGQEFPIKSLYVAGCGLVSGTSDTNRIINEVINKVEFIVVADHSFTDTVKYADIILPVGHYYEQEDMFGGVTADPYALYDDKVIDPLYECKPDGDIIRIFADKLGAGEWFSKTDDEFFEEVWDNDQLRTLGITPKAVKEKHAIRFVPEYTVSNPECVYPTTTTRLEFYVENPTPRVNYGQSFDVEFERLPRFRPPKEAWPDHEIMKKYPLILISERPRDRFHSMGFQDTLVLEIEPEPNFKINPLDAERYAVKEGDYCEVYNDRGHAVAIAHLSEGIRPGSLLYPKGWQIEQFKVGSWSELTSSDFDPVAVNNSFFDTVVEIRKWTEEA
jgi:anaerobic selenocysteine-containing dehydrogenase